MFFEDVAYYGINVASKWRAGLIRAKLALPRFSATTYIFQVFDSV
jgi:hypothetical protein